MRIIWPIILWVSIIAISLFLIDVSANFLWIVVMISLLVPFIISSNYKSFQRNVLDSAATDEKIRVFDDIHVINGGTVINRSGMSVNYDIENPITFLTISAKGIDGAVTLAWNNITKFEKRDDSIIRLHLKKYFRFFNTTKVDFKFKTDVDAINFYQEAAKQMENSTNAIMSS